MRRVWGVLWRVLSIGCVILIAGVLFLHYTGLLDVGVTSTKGFQQPDAVSLETDEGIRQLPKPIQEASRAVVFVQVRRAAGEREFPVHLFQSPKHKGSGVIVDPHHVLTAFHVVDSAFGTSAGAYLPVEVTVAYGDTAYRATPVAFDAVFDLALLRVSEELPFSAEVEASWDLWYAPGSFYAVGYFPSGEDSFAKSAYTTHFDEDDAIRHVPIAGETFFILPVEEPNFAGFSGGPVFDNQGNILGIMTSVYKGAGGWQLRGASGYIIQRFLLDALSK